MIRSVRGRGQKEDSPADHSRISVFLRSSLAEDQNRFSLFWLYLFLALFQLKEVEEELREKEEVVRNNQAHLSEVCSKG